MCRNGSAFLTDLRFRERRSLGQKAPPQPGLHLPYLLSRDTVLPLPHKRSEHRKDVLGEQWKRKNLGRSPGICTARLGATPWWRRIACLPKTTGYCSKCQGETQEGDTRDPHVTISTRDIPNLFLYQGDQLLRFGMKHMRQMLVLVLQL